VKEWGSYRWWGCRRSNRGRC